MSSIAGKARGDAYANLWNRPDLVRRFIEARLLYGQLAQEVAFILEKRVRDRKIPLAHVTRRTKTLESFAEKVERKHYGDPLKEVTDIAGVRVVYLYESTRASIGSLIEAEFVFEKDDKQAQQKDDQFGYKDLQYVVTLKDATGGARYEDLKSLKCEIQVRSVMQDAWAIFSHHLVYKNEASTPQQIKRRLNGISASFECIEEQLDRMREEMEVYRSKIEKESGTKGFLKQEINFETLRAYLQRKFPDEIPYGGNSSLNFVIKRLREHGYEALGEIAKALERTRKAREFIRKTIDVQFSVFEVVYAIALINAKYRSSAGYPPFVLRAFKESEHLVEKA